MNEEAAKKAVSELQWQIERIKEDKTDMSSVSWGYQYGVLITGNDAQALIELWNFYQMYKPQ